MQHYMHKPKKMTVNAICHYSLWSVLPTPCCRSTSRKRH